METRAKFARAIGIAALAIGGTVDALWIRDAYERSYFVGDDLFSFWAQRNQTFFRFLASPIDVHVVPLHRLVSFAVYHAAPMNFAVALLVLGVVHAATVFALYDVLQRIRRTPWNLVLLAVYMLNPTLKVLFYWWTSGLHRLPCELFSVLALGQFLRYRQTRTPKPLVLLVAFTFAALGFYSKGILIPFYIAVFAAAAWYRTGAAERRATLHALLVLVVPVVAYLLLWRATTEGGLHALNTSLEFHRKFHPMALEVTMQSFFGYWCDGRPAVKWAVGVISASVVGLSLSRDPRAAYSWIGLVLALLASWLVIAMSLAKTRVYGLMLVAGDRYYFENAFLVIVFVALAFSAERTPPKRWNEWVNGPADPILASVALLLVIWIAKNGHDSFELLIASQYEVHLSTRAYFVKVRNSLRQIPPDERNPLPVADGGFVPQFIVPKGIPPSRQSEMLTLLGESVRRERHGYKIAPSGHLSWH